MYHIKKFFFTTIQLLLLFDSTKQSKINQLKTAIKAISSTIKNPFTKTIQTPIKRSLGMLLSTKNTVKNFACTFKKKCLGNRNIFGSPKYILPPTVKAGTQLSRLESKKRNQMRSAEQIRGKGPDIRKLVNKLSKSKTQKKFLIGGGLMKFTQFNIIQEDVSMNKDGTPNTEWRDLPPPIDVLDGYEIDENEDTPGDSNLVKGIINYFKSDEHKMHQKEASKNKATQIETPESEKPPYPDNIGELLGNYEIAPDQTPSLQVINNIEKFQKEHSENQVKDETNNHDSNNFDDDIDKLDVDIKPGETIDLLNLIEKQNNLGTDESGATEIEASETKGSDSNQLGERYLPNAGFEIENVDSNSVDKSSLSETEALEKENVDSNTVDESSLSEAEALEKKNVDSNTVDESSLPEAEVFKKENVKVLDYTYVPETEHPGTDALLKSRDKSPPHDTKTPKKKKVSKKNKEDPNFLHASFLEINDEEHMTESRAKNLNELFEKFDFGSNTLDVKEKPKTSIAEKLKFVLVNIAETQKQSTHGQDVRLVAVSKSKTIEDIKEAYDAGQRHFGENYADEYVGKRNYLPKDIKWHFVGHLQSNKVNRLVNTKLWCIETVDSVKQAKKINNACQEHNMDLNVMIQLKMSDKAVKSGISEDKALKLTEYILNECKNLKFKGYMAMGESGDPIVYTKAWLTKLKAVKQFGLEQKDVELSMGMTGDYHEAIKAGSNNIRIGTQIFGARTPKVVKEID